MSDRDEDSVEMSEEIAAGNHPETEGNLSSKPTEDASLREENAESDGMGQLKSKLRKLNRGRVEKEDVEIPEGDGTFMCGVVEGFYGRPWTTGQRKELFRRMKTMGMNTYLYGPKDDYKHRLYWRDLYSEDETALLQLLMESAAEFDVLFIYAISPGLDMSFASPKELECLKNKLLQVQSLGCKAFALLFDDIDPILSVLDKAEYASAASAQVGVTNQMHQALGGPKFLFCPTEYCSTMAIPDVVNSKYLETIGKELHKNISIMWTGPKVVSKQITVESIKQLTKIVRRKVTIWDNIHANDYDPKRMFLGPYKGRSTDLIPLLSGVLTNPNCEFESNFIAMHTLATWWKSHVAQMEKSVDGVGKMKKQETEDKKEISESDVKTLLVPASDLEKTEKDESVNVAPNAQPEDSGLCKEGDLNPESTAEKTDSKEMATEEAAQGKDKPDKADGSQAVGNATSRASSGVSSLIGSDDSDTDSDYSSHDDYYAMSRQSDLAPFNHGTYDPDSALKEAIKSWLPFFSTAQLYVGKPIARSGPPMGMLSQSDMALISSSPMGPSSSTTRALPIDPITSTPMPSFDGEILKRSSGIETVGHEQSQEDEIPKIDTLDEVEKPEPADVEMTTATPSATPLETVATTEETKAEADDVKMQSDSDSDLKLLVVDSDLEQKRPEEMGDSGERETKTVEQNTLMETEDAEPMQTEADPDSDVSMATNNSAEEKKIEKDDQEDRDTMGSASGSSSVTMTTPPREESSSDQTPEKVVYSLRERTSSDDTLEALPQFKIEPMTLEDVELAVELFYLPYEHGGFGRRMVQDFLWLQSNIRDSVMPPNASKSAKNESMDKAVEWMERALKFEDSCSSIRGMCSKLITCSNRALLYDLFPYFWDMKGVVSMLSTYVKWMGQFYLRRQPAITPEPPEASSNSSKPASHNSAPVSITSSSMPPLLPAAVWLGNDPEPWVFRGGLSGEFQRLLPIAMANDLFCQAIPCSPPANSTTYTIRPYLNTDETAVHNICLTTGNDGTDFADDFTGFEDLPGQWLAGGLLTLSPEYCFVVEDDLGICGYLVGTADAKSFWKKFSIAMWPELKELYTPRKEEEVGEEVRRFIDEVCRDEEPDSYAVDNLYDSHPAYMQIAVHRRVTDPTIAKSMTVCMLSALKSHGVHGAHTTVRSSDCYMPDLYCRLGFRQIRPFDMPTTPLPCSMDSKDDTIIVFGRNF